MNCEKCQDLLSDFLDGALSVEEHHLLNAHLEECLSCFTTRDELDSIVSYCRDCRGEYEAPPNEHALWLRIRNTIEAESASALPRSASVSVRREHRWTHWLNRSWELSLSQMAMAVAAIVVAVSLATAFSLHRMQGNPEGAGRGGSTLASVSDSGGSSRPALTTSNLHVRGVSQEIDYWQQRVDERKGRWSQQRREDFELNLKVINEAVEERLKDLKENPHDDMTEEMLNAVLNNKAELLKEFSDL